MAHPPGPWMYSGDGKCTVYRGVYLNSMALVSSLLFVLFSCLILVLCEMLFEQGYSLFVFCISFQCLPKTPLSFISNSYHSVTVGFGVSA